MITYETFMKHAEKVCKNSFIATRKMLSGVKHLENGSLICTDSHRLYVAKGLHTRDDGAVFTPAGKVLDGNYPDVSRLVPDPLYAKQSLKIELSELYRAADMIAAVGTIAEHAMATKNNPAKPPAMEIKGDEIRYYNHQVKIKYSLPMDFQEFIFANAVYVLDAMKLFKAAGCQTVTLNYFGKMRPFTITNDDEDLLVLILPIRKQ